MYWKGRYRRPSCPRPRQRDDIVRRVDRGIVSVGQGQTFSGIERSSLLRPRPAGSGSRRSLSVANRPPSSGRRARRVRGGAPRHPAPSRATGGGKVQGLVDGVVRAAAAGQAAGEGNGGAGGAGATAQPRAADGAILALVATPNPKPEKSRADRSDPAPADVDTEPPTSHP